MIAHTITAVSTENTTTLWLTKATTHTMRMKSTCLTSPTTQRSLSLIPRSTTTEHLSIISIMTTIIPMCLTLAGRKHTAALPVSHSHLALMTRRRMALYATPTASLASMESVPSAGKTAHMTMDSVTTAHTATNLMPMAVELVKCTSALAAKSGAPSGTLRVTTNSIMSAAAFAHQIAPLV